MNRPGLPPSLASTMAFWAMSPSVTGIFTPLIDPSITVVDRLDAVTAPGPSDVAKQPISSPDAIFGSSSAFWASLPASITASAKK